MNIFGKRHELYECFRISDTSNIFRLTSNGRDVVHNGYRFLKSTIRGSSVKKNTALEKQTYELSLDLDSEQGRYFVSSSQENHIYLKVYEYNGIEAFVVWGGRLTGVKISGNIVKLNFEQATTMMQKDGLYRKTSKLCPFILYGKDCGVDSSYHRISARITAATTNGRLTFSTLSTGIAANTFKGGFISMQNSDRFLVTENGTDWVQLFDYDIDFSELIGSDVVIYEGCDKSPKTCKEKFGNLDNCGSFSLMPEDDPFKGVIM